MTGATHWSEPFFGSLYMRFDLLRAENLARTVTGIVRRTNIGPGTRVAELCCGYGRVLIPLAAKSGARATGIDQSHSLLSAAKLSASEQGVPVRWIEADLRRFLGRNDFDVTYLIATSFGYYDGKEANRKILRAARSCLKKNGIFLLEQANNPKILDVRRQDGQFRYEMHGEFDPVSRRYTGWYEYIDKISHRTFHYPFSVVLYRQLDLVAMLKESGFGMFQSYSGLGGRPFTDKAKRLVIVCRAI